MKNLQNLLTELNTTEIPTIETEEGTKYNQTYRNKLRRRIVEALLEDFLDLGFDAYQVDRGVAFIVPNEELGSISFILAPTMTSLDYDPEEEADLFQQKQEKKKKKA